MDHKQVKQILLKNKRVRQYLEKPDVRWVIAKNVLEARLIRGMSQKQLAQKIGTEQPAIARIESGNNLPSNLTLDKIAHALGTELIPPTFKSLTKEAKFVHEDSSNAITYFPAISSRLGTAISLCLDFFSDNSSVYEEVNVNLTEI